MAEYVVICSPCGAENHDWQEHDGTMWFTCTSCKSDNELVKLGK